MRGSCVSWPSVARGISPQCSIKGDLQGRDQADSSQLRRDGACQIMKWNRTITNSHATEFQLECAAPKYARMDMLALLSVSVVALRVSSVIITDAVRKEPALSQLSVDA